jgi:hypothetical protein
MEKLKILLEPKKYVFIAMLLFLWCTHSYSLVEPNFNSISASSLISTQNAMIFQIEIAHNSYISNFFLVKPFAGLNFGKTSSAKDASIYAYYVGGELVFNPLVCFIDTASSTLEVYLRTLFNAGLIKSYVGIQIGLPSGEDSLFFRVEAIESTNIWLGFNATL